MKAFSNKKKSEVLHGLTFKMASDFTRNYMNDSATYLDVLNGSLSTYQNIQPYAMAYRLGLPEWYLELARYLVEHTVDDQERNRIAYKFIECVPTGADVDDMRWDLAAHLFQILHPTDGTTLVLSSVQDYLNGTATNRWLSQTEQFNRISQIRSWYPDTPSVKTTQFIKAFIDADVPDFVMIMQNVITQNTGTEAEKLFVECASVITHHAKQLKVV